MLLWSLWACTGAPAPNDEEHGHDHGHDQTEKHGDHATAHHRFDDAEKWSKIFDDPKRDAWQKPVEVVAGMAIEPGMTVADIGAGTGYFNPHLAKAVGAEGRVIAIDIEPNLIAHMTERAKKDATPNVEARITKPDAHGLKDGEADRVLLVDTYHHIADRTAYFGSLRTAMKPGGTLTIVDLTKDAPFGPPANERLTAQDVTTELTEAGWTRKGEVVSLEHQYVVVFE